jgi:hypothetical protein
MKSPVKLPKALLVALVLLPTASLGSGCSSSTPSETAAGGSAGSSSGSGGSNSMSGANNSGGSSVLPAQEIHGGVNVDLKPMTEDGDAYTTLIARFFDGPTPEALPLELDSEEGDCQLWVPVFPFCSEPCAPDACTADDVCTPYPKPFDAGTLGVQGLGDALMIEPASAMHVYQSPSLPNPACVEGEPVTATVAGLSLEAQCIAQLELTATDPIPVHTGETVQVGWVPASAGDSKIRIGLDIAHHGGKKGEIDCEVPDTGSFEIPEPLVTKLIGLGLAGFPTISVTRISVGSDASQPNVELTLASNVQHPVDTGVVSCQEKEQCPADQDCLETKICG